MFLVEMKRQKGGVKWKQGSDGCIFNPSVACQSESGEISFHKSNTISKIMPLGSIDEKVERFLQTHFPDLVAKKGVLVAQEHCTPFFLDTNLTFNKNLNQSDPLYPCMKITEKSDPKNYTNFVIEQYDGEFAKIFKKSNITDILHGLRHALNAAVTLVPDNGPWVLGFDFHLGNIFVKKEGKKINSSLADWGRTIIIENPNDPTSLRKGLYEGLQLLRNTGWQSMQLLPSGRLVKIPLIQFEDYGKGYIQTHGELPQFPDSVRKAMDDVYKRPVINGVLNQNVHVIRLTTIIGIIKCLAYLQAFQTPRERSLLSTILGKLDSAESQADIAKSINEYITSTYYTNGYIDLTMFSPSTVSNSIGAGSTKTTTKPTPAATSNVVGAGAGAAPTTPPAPEGYLYMGGKRTRKHKQKRKRKQTRRV